MPGVPDQLTLFQPGGTDYAHLITTRTPGFSDLPTALLYLHHLLESNRYVVMLQDAPSSIKLARGHLNSFIAVKSGYPFAIDDGIKISLPEIITYKHVLRARACIYWI